jgi:hypothetical protein
MTAPNQDPDRVAAECRAAVSRLATAMVLRDESALRYLSGEAEFGGTLPARQMMLSAAYLVGDVLGTGLVTALKRQPTGAEITQAWDQTAKQARERLTSSPDAAAMDAGMVTALPLLTAFISHDMAGFRRGAAAAAGEKQLTMAVLAAALIARDLFETAVNTSVGGAATDEQVQREWEKFMARRAASKRGV